MLSDDELLDHDASDSIFAKETPRDTPGGLPKNIHTPFN